ncbi:cell division protein ZapA [Muribaculaceae bacterium Isolate-037 (Harlan)]|uniref:Cell division protein ZapA n=1 Tax=Lepagella muris TaxID=3032870 RepID=A0AC61RAT0_9BACT|nr:cell division protein ZapA [Muribaculaceae bacterium Isolate-037 (Harlan)]TGY76962.1 cell division protein ZapA [Lepagella muris]THG48627.1 cell division protein ZapA [Bacteroidales bacterium]TKC58932.1 cell division protein ZapA [Bacteroidales bacterium]
MHLHAKGGMTMNDSDNVKMTINIGGEHIRLTVAFNSQDIVRDAEKAATQLFDEWRRKWPSRSDKEVMAMVAYQFAYFYRKLLIMHADAADIAQTCNHRLSDLLALDYSSGI